MERKLYTKEQVISLIEAGRHMVLTADENMLSLLPKGNWIGGTIPYFMDTEGGIYTTQKIFVDDFTSLGIDFNIREFDETDIREIANTSYENGFSILLIPGESSILEKFAMYSENYENIFRNPVMGYVTGCAVDEMETAIPKIFNGITGKSYAGKAIALHVKLPDNKIARVEIVNIFKPIENSDIITFPESGFKQSICYVNGEKRFLTEYLEEKKYNTQLPLIANQGGSLINKSFRLVNKESKEVTFFAPLQAYEKYMMAQKVIDYGKQFSAEINKIPLTVFVCNCILNHLYGQFEGKVIKLNWKTTFGEIAYKLLNQTLIYLTIDEM